MADVTKLVIERSRWLRGGPSVKSALLREGRMCCLGFFGLACGATEDEIRDRANPVTSDLPVWPDWLVEGEDQGRCHTGDATQLMNINDDETIGDGEREPLLAEIFAKHGVEVEFR